MEKYKHKNNGKNLKINFKIAFQSYIKIILKNKIYTIKINQIKISNNFFVCQR